MLCEKLMFSFKYLTVKGKFWQTEAHVCFKSINFCFQTPKLKLNAIISCKYHKTYLIKCNTLTDEEIYKHTWPSIQLKAVRIFYFHSNFLNWIIRSDEVEWLIAFWRTVVSSQTLKEYIRDPQSSIHFTQHFEMSFMTSVKSTINICSCKGLKYSLINLKAMLERINTTFFRR